MQWFRWYAGSCEDGKFRMAARNAKVTVATVMGVWAMLLEDASHADHRGVCARGEDFYAAVLDLDSGELQLVLEAMQSVGLISVGHGGITISRWKERQFETDLKDPTNAERQRRHRRKQKEKVGGADRNTSDTKRNAGITAATRPDTESDTDTEVPPKAPQTGGGAKRLPSDWENRFEECRDAYPSRGKATNPVKPAKEKFGRLIRDGTDPLVIIAGTKGYASAMAELGYAGTDRVKQMLTFLNQAVWEQYQPKTNGAGGTDPPRTWQLAHKRAAYEGQFPGGEAHEAVANEIMVLIRAGDDDEADKRGVEYLTRGVP